MMMRRTGARRDAPALRFLVGCVGGWVLLRVMMLWNPALPRAPAAIPVTSQATSSVAPTGDATAMTSMGRIGAHAMRPAKPATDPVGSEVALHGDSRAGPAASNGGITPFRDEVRLATMAQLLPPLPGGAARTGAASSTPAWLVAAPRRDPAHDDAFWIRRRMAGWSATSWLYLRDGSAEAFGAIGAASQLGGSQGGVRLGYGFGATGRMRAYVRTTMAIERPQQREAAFGLVFAPLAQLPVDVAVEQRVAAGREGRTALAAMASGGVSDVALPAGFRLDAYAQAGIVGARRRDAFADGAVVIDRGLGGDDAALRLGAFAAGAVQPGAQRVDVGPRLTLRLPDVGQGSRIALDWRQRVAGDAYPESGVALTLAADF